MINPVANLRQACAAGAEVETIEEMIDELDDAEHDLLDELAADQYATAESV